MPAPASTGGGVVTLHRPCVPPGGTTHISPAQQSALIVHVCPPWRQSTPPSGFNAAHTSVPFGPGMHGVQPVATPPSGLPHVVPPAVQQSSEFEQACPAPTQVETAQRGTPSGSSSQILLLGLGTAQQSSAFDELPHV